MVATTVPIHLILANLLSHSLALVIALALLVVAAQAQTSATDGTTPAALAPGAPAGSYSLGDFENINLFNGNLSATLRLLQVGGRGRAGYTMALPIEQHWRTVNGEFADSLGNVYEYSYAEANWWDGLKPGYSPGVLQSRTAASQPGNCDPNIYAGSFNSEVLARLTFTSPDASEHELVDAQTNGAPHIFGICGGEIFSRGKAFVSNDGAGMTFISDQPVTENNTTWGSVSRQVFSCLPTVLATGSIMVWLLRFATAMVTFSPLPTARILRTR